MLGPRGLALGLLVLVAIGSGFAVSGVAGVVAGWLGVEPAGGGWFRGRVRVSGFVTRPGCSVNGGLVYVSGVDGSGAAVVVGLPVFAQAAPEAGSCVYVEGPVVCSVAGVPVVVARVYGGCGG